MTKGLEMNQKNIKKVLVAILLTLTLFLGIKITYAATSDFTVSPSIPQNQVEGNHGYFNLLMKPGTSQEISINLSNTTSHSITVEMSFARSTTNGNGLAIYDTTTAKADDSLKYNIEDYVKLPQKEITLAAHSQTAVVSKVTMPTSDFNGVLAGGFAFKEKSSESSSNPKNGVSIINEYRYVIALVMQQNTKAVSPQLHLNQVEASQINSRNIISANLQNSASTYLQDMNASATVKGVTHPELKYSFENSEMKMAPNSNFDLAIPVSIQGNMANQTSKALQPGKYHLSMTVYGVKSAEGRYQTTVNGQTVKYEYKWNFERDFEIAGAKASKLNRSDPTVRYKEPMNWLMIIGIALILIVVLLIFLVFISKRKKDNHIQNDD
ncbi:DUF916 and DUF3324 domain-containing protein [Lactococcus protaetiae]|uniref:DUF916 and DUF3324 domain-containing protein n=1 Tax=Lactococcus protaetiae TaxID=2592653 RepID=A0A514Z8E7_9LACT|nr:DUF916 and DUF3324 domain-containing protein [Lactococcus protaetiae]QDK70864.1 DUF916 and DUF3324 domain-containing protein [Lactococcus protaetiae]